MKIEINDTGWQYQQTLEENGKKYYCFDNGNSHLEIGNDVNFFIDGKKVICRGVYGLKPRRIEIFG